MLRCVYCTLVCGSCRTGLFTEMMNSECMSGRDYQGWVDFGRRDAEWDVTVAATAPELTLHCFLFRFYTQSMFYFPCNFRNKQLCRIITSVGFIAAFFTNNAKLYWMEMQSFIHRWYNLYTHWHTVYTAVMLTQNRANSSAEKQWFGWLSYNLCLWLLPFLIHSILCLFATSDYSERFSQKHAVSIIMSTLLL